MPYDTRVLLMSVVSFLVAIKSKPFVLFSWSPRLNSVIGAKIWDGSEVCRSWGLIYVSERVATKASLIENGSYR
jgi:hypothetical protein